MGQAEKYKNIRRMVAALVLAIAMTSGLEIKYFRRTPLAVAEKQYWHSEGNVQDLRANIPTRLDTRTTTRIESELDRGNSNMQRPSLALIGRADLTSDDHPLNLGPILTNPKCPRFKISLDLLSLHECERSLKQRCKAEECRGQIEKWSIQKPFYVEEPRWVQIELDYAQNLPYAFNTEDPFFLSRGKKIFRTRTIAKSDSDRSNISDDYVRVNFLDDGEEENRVRKRNGSKRKEERRKNLQLNNRQLEDLVRHFDPIDDPFFLSRGKKLFARDILKEVSLNDLENETVERKLHEEAKRSVINEIKRSEINESNEVKNTSINSSLMNKDNETSSSESEETERVSSRTKRSSCTDFGCNNDDSEKIGEKFGWTKDIKSSSFDSSNIQRRDKHSDISDLFNEPFFISRGKKASKDIDYESRSTSIDYNESLNSLAIAKRILQRLLDYRKCKTEACDDLDGFFKDNGATMTDRDRRSYLDDLLRKYDPFYVARGKRIRLDDVSEDQPASSRVSQRGEIYSKDRLSYYFGGNDKR